MADICFICDNSLSDADTVVVVPGLQTLKDASVNRADVHMEHLKNVNTVTIHVQFRKDYIRKSSTLAFKRRRDEDASYSVRALLQPRHVAEDTDILVLLIARNSPNKQIHFLKPCKGKVETKIYSSASIGNYTYCQEHFLLIYQKYLSRKNYPSNVIVDNGILSIDNYRYLTFAKSTRLNTPVKFPSLPPTAAAARQYLYPVYYQLQTWLGNELNSEQWGLVINNNLLESVMTLLPPAPDGGGRGRQTVRQQSYRLCTPPHCDLRQKDVFAHGRLQDPASNTITCSEGSLPSPSWRRCPKRLFEQGRVLAVATGGEGRVKIDPTLPPPPLQTSQRPGPCLGVRRTFQIKASDSLRTRQATEPHQAIDDEPEEQRVAPEVISESKIYDCEHRCSEECDWQARLLDWMRRELTVSGRIHYAYKEGKSCIEACIAAERDWAAIGAMTTSLSVPTAKT
ncbi:hypothetical protein PR048_014941 [Dryococelus australis]|uniref:Uncharacterized protein n=1 Tax=Dryococelus australis TaxID=614101 RepID=A0ABQ9HFT3_9NEOP|nr:hypothetical protein PR048_014941 [Dryococelus australis]